MCSKCFSWKELTTENLESSRNSILTGDRNTGIGLYLKVVTALVMSNGKFLGTIVKAKTAKAKMTKTASLMTSWRSHRGESERGGREEDETARRGDVGRFTTRRRAVLEQMGFSGQEPTRRSYSSFEGKLMSLAEMDTTLATRYPVIWAIKYQGDNRNS